MSYKVQTTLARFVAWLNGLSVFQLKVHSKYTGADFDEDIRHVLRRVGCRNEKVCFIMDESNMLDTGFLERLNTLLANGEVPGLFEGDEFTTLINQIKEGSQRQGLMLDSTEELYKWFTSQIIRNLHVVFTMNPSGDSLRQRASTSPALFNRCVLNWFGDWSNKALYQVGMELTSNMDITSSGYVPPAAMEHVCDALPKQHIQYHHAVINSFVHVHNVIRRTNDEERKRGHKSIAVTPRHFLDFIQHYTGLFGEKRRGLEDEKIHINIGLRKIQETQEQVKELQLSLNQKGQELNDKKQAAEAKLKQMLADQAEAESEKKVSESLQRELSTQLKEIAQKKEEVGAELATVEPIVQSAKDAVQGIKKSQLAELKTMVQPPNGVKLALESICLLIDDDAGSDWKKIRATIVKDDFISRILLFNTESLSQEIVKAMERYEQNPDWDYERVNRASVACGPLIQWMKAQLAYYRILSKVDPLRRELKRLENDAIVKTKKGEELKTHIAAIEERIATYKEEYAQLIGQSEGIKADLVSVEQKVERSTRLLNSLKAEKTRWEEGSQSFTQQMSTLVGDVLLSSAFLSYCGYFDQHLREVIFQRWIDELQVAQIAFRPELA